MSTLTWITEEELEREIKKTKETNFVGRITSKFYSDGEKCEILAELAATKVKMSGSEKRMNMNTYNIFSIKRVTGKFLAEFHVVAVKKPGKEMYKKVCCTCKVIVVFFFC